MKPQKEQNLPTYLVYFQERNPTKEQVTKQNETTNERTRISTCQEEKKKEIQNKFPTIANI